MYEIVGQLEDNDVPSRVAKYSDLVTISETKASVLLTILEVLENTIPTKTTTKIKV